MNGLATVGVRLVALCLGLGLALATLSAQAEAGTQRASAVAAGAVADKDEPRGSDDPAVSDLVADLGITVEEAELQMRNQAQAATAEAEMPDALKRVFSGRRIFHDDGARVEVASTNRAMESAFREHYESYGVAIDVVVAALSLDHTEALIDETNNALRSSRLDGSTPLVRASERVPGQVTITVAAGELNLMEQQAVDRARQEPAEYELEHVDQLLVGEETACDYTPDIWCDPPLRGSMAIARDNPNKTLICTAGFLARSRSDSKPYVLTAGHCRVSTNVWARFANGQPHAIGPWHDSDNNANTDIGIVTVENPSGWAFGWPIITVAPNHGQDDDYVIDAVGEPFVGDRICFTAGNGNLALYIGGTFNGGRTDCGTVDARYDTGGGTDGLFRVENVCLVPGDSGSPAFSYGVAYGVQSASNYQTSCSHSWSEQASEAQDLMRVNIVTA